MGVMPGLAMRVRLRMKRTMELKRVGCPLLQIGVNRIRMSLPPLDSAASTLGALPAWSAVEGQARVSRERASSAMLTKAPRTFDGVADRRGSGLERLPLLCDGVATISTSSQRSGRTRSRRTYGRAGNRSIQR